MKKQEKIVEIIYETYRSIDFINKYKDLFSTYNFDLDTIMSRMNKRENLNVIKELGYKFKIFTPGQYYEYEETFENIKLALSCQISGGMVTEYIYIYIDGENINHRYGLRNNLAFVYRTLLNSPQEKLNAPKFRNYEDLKEIMKSIIEIYEDFKKEFLSRMKAEKLMEK
jgi:hypothetical protein